MSYNSLSPLAGINNEALGGTLAGRYRFRQLLREQMRVPPRAFSFSGIQMDYKKHYDLLIEKHGSKVKPKEIYTERHHIVPRCLGGTDNSENLVFLTARAHYVAHQLLVKLNPGHRKLAFAALTMTVTPHGHRNNNRSYAWIRNRFAESQRGEANVVHRPDVKLKLRSPKSEAHKEKLRKPKSEEHVQKMREARLGKKLSPEHVKAIADAVRANHPMKGRVQSEKARKLISEANKVKVTCSICGGLFVKSVISKYHNERCKKVKP